MTRLRWNERQSPTDLDDSPDTLPDYSFDYRRCTEHGKPSWPEKHGKEKFGPALIGKAWKAGLVVVAEVEGFPRPVAVTESRWGAAGVLQVRVSGSWCIPERLWTRTTVRGLDSTGLLVDGG